MGDTLNKPRFVSKQWGPLLGKQLKSLYLSQLIAFADSVSKFYRQAYDSPDETEMETVIDFQDDMLKSFEVVKNDIHAIPEDFGASHRQFLIDRSEEFLQLAKLLQKEFTSGDDDEFLRVIFTKAVSKWRGDLGDTDRDVRELIKAFGLDEDLLRQMEHEPETLEDLLNSTVNRKINSPEYSEKQRANSPLIRLLQVGADRYKRNIEKNANKIKESTAERKEILKVLEEQAIIKYASGVPGACALEAKSLQSDVVITASKLSKKGKDAAMARVIVIGDPITKKTVFHLKDKLIQRQG